MLQSSFHSKVNKSIVIMLPLKTLTQGSLSKRFARRNEVFMRETFAYSDPDHSFEVKPAGFKGNGLFAKKKFKEGEYILTYWGERLEKKTYKLLEKAEYGLEYVFNYQNKEFINAANPDESGIARFANDEVNFPTMKPFSYIYQSKSHVGFRAVRDIEIGEELTYNYGENVIAPWRNSEQTKSDDENRTPEMPKLQKRRTPISTDSDDVENSYKIRTRYRNFRKFYKKSEIKYPGSDTPELSSDSPVSDSAFNYVDGYDVDRARRELGLLIDEKNPQSPRNADVLVPETDCTSDGYHEMVNSRNQNSKNKEDGNKSVGNTGDNNANRKPDSHHQENPDETSMPPLEEISPKEKVLAGGKEAEDNNSQETVTEQLFVPQPMYVPEFKKIEPRKRKLSSDEEFNPTDEDSSEYDSESEKENMEDEPRNDEERNEFQNPLNSQPLSTRSEENEAERPNSSGQFIATKLKLCCFFCQKPFAKDSTLKRHLETIHRMTKTNATVVTRATLFEQTYKGKRTIKYFCKQNSCLKYFDRLDRHRRDHASDIITIKAVTDLPQYILNSAHIMDTPTLVPIDNTLNWTRKGSYDFGDELIKFSDFKRAQNSDRAGHSNLESTIKTSVNRLTKCIEITNGLTSVTKITYWLHGQNEVFAPSTRTRMLDELKQFVEFLISEHGTKQKQKLDTEQILSLIRILRKQEIGPKKRWKQVQQSIRSANLPSIDETETLQREMYNYLQKTLEQTSISSLDYRRVQCTLITMLILRNVSRTAEITRSLTSYFLLVQADEEDENIFHVRCEPPEMQTNSKSGERKAVKKLYDIIEQSHKTFHISGVKNLSMTKQELEFIALYLKYRVKIGRFEDEYMFQPLEITNADKIDSDGIYNRNRQYYRVVKSLFKTKANFTSRNIRKVCKSKFVNDENKSEAQLRNMNKAIGHLGSTSHSYYEIATNKRMESRTVSQQLDRILSSARPQLETAASITEILPQITETESELREEEAAETENSGEEYEESSSSASENEGPATKKEILQFLRTRKQRKGRQTYVASDELNEWLADFYLRRKNGEKCESIAAEAKKFEEKTQTRISRDAVDTIFKLIDKWLSCNKNIL